MKESSNDSSELELSFSDSNVRSIQYTLCKRLRVLEEEKSDESLQELLSVCDVVKEKILNSKDESHLSKNQNNCRRIHIASELLVSISSLHDVSVDIEYTKTVNYLINAEALKKFARKIKLFQNFELKKEKLFILKAESLLKKDSEDLIQKDIHKEKDASPRQEEEVQQEQIQQELQPQMPNGEIELPVEESFRGERFVQTIGNITLVRAFDETLDLIPRTAAIPRPENSFHATQPEISIRHTEIEDQREQDIQELLHILDDNAVNEVVAEISKPDDLPVSAVEEGIVEKTRPEVVQEDKEDEILPVNVEDWNLSDLEELSEKPKKKSVGLIIDENITIRDYAPRAVALNRNIEIKRVQVYEGPPVILQAMSCQYLMKTSGFRNTMDKDKTTGSLNRLLKRHLITEKKPPENFDVLKKRRYTEGPREARDVTVQDIREERRTKAGMHAEIPEARELLADVIPEQSRRDETTRPSTILNVNGIDGSLIQMPTVEPPILEKEMLQRPISTSPRIQQLQGTKPDKPKTTQPWFYSVRKTPPSEKLREFRYVMEKLEEYWNMAELESNERTLTVHQFLSMEGNTNVADYLTLIRILDKLSLQRKVYLECKPEGFSVKPFEAVRIPQK